MNTVLDLYCGGGGFSEGFRQSGFKIVFGLDNNKNCCKTFKYNFPNSKVVCADILSYDGEYPSVDVVIGSPPCKEFSRANHSRSWDMQFIDRFLEIVKIVKPKYFVMENVPEVRDAINPLFSKYSGTFPTQLILCSYDFGCATIRTRLFAGNYPRNLEKSYIKYNVKDVINPNVSGFKQPYKEYVYRKIDPNKPLNTIVAQRIHNQRYLLPNGRTLECSELACIQGFPSWFIFPVARSVALAQIGNSVSPPVAKSIGLAIKKGLEGV